MMHTGVYSYSSLRSWASTTTSFSSLKTFAPWQYIFLHQHGSTDTSGLSEKNQHLTKAGSDDHLWRLFYGQMPSQMIEWLLSMNNGDQFQFQLLPLFWQHFKRHLTRFVLNASCDFYNNLKFRWSLLNPWIPRILPTLPSSIGKS